MKYQIKIAVSRSPFKNGLTDIDGNILMRFETKMDTCHDCGTEKVSHINQWEILVPDLRYT